MQCWTMYNNIEQYWCTSYKVDIVDEQFMLYNMQNIKE